MMEQHLLLLIELQMHPNQRIISQRHGIVDSQLIGKGSTGNVYLGFQLQPPHQKVAIKAIDLRNIDNEVTKYLLSCEITALVELSKIDLPGHENIVKVHEIVPQGDYIYIVTELLEGGTLGQYIKTHPNGLPEDQCLHYLRQMFEGYLLIASKNIIHRDIKPDNLIFRSRTQGSNDIAFIDFGYASMEMVKNRPQVYYNVGSPKYMSPEAYKANKYSQKSDLWAIGVIFYQMLLGKTCDQGHTMDSYLEMVRTRGLPLPDRLRPLAKQLLAGLLSYNPDNRYSCLQALKILKQNQQSGQPSNQPRPQSQMPRMNNPRANVVFKSAMMSPASQLVSPLQNVVNSQFMTPQALTRSHRKQERHEREEPNMHRLVKSRSANNIQVSPLQNAKPQTPQILVQQGESVQQMPSMMKAHFENFKGQNSLFGDQVQVVERKLIPQRLSYNQAEYGLRPIRMISRPQPVPDENSLRAIIRNRNSQPMHPGIIRKIVGNDRMVIGGLVGQEPVNQRQLMEMKNGSVIRQSKFQFPKPIICKQEIRGGLPFRNLSVPKTVLHH